MGTDRDRGWLPELDHGEGPLYLRIAEALAQARASGALQPGDRLPPQRELAQRLGVDLTTITRAFTEARRRNLIEASPGRGTFVTPGGPDEPILDLSMNMPPAPQGLNLPALIRSGIEGLLKRSSADALLSYHPGPGSPAERASGSLWLGKRAPRLPTDRLLVGAGAQSLLAAVMLAMTDDAEIVLTDRLTYPGFIALAAASNRRLAGVAADEHGMRPDDLEKVAREHGARLVYLNPTLHNPTTLTMPETRRIDLIEIARRMRLVFVEDDPYSPLLSSSPPSFLALAPDITIHVATLAKCISPFLRTGFCALPDVRTAEIVARHLRGLTLMAPPLMTGLACEWIRDGTADEIVGEVRRESDARQSLAADILPFATGVGSGFHIWMPLTLPHRTAAVLDRAQGRGLAVSGAGEFEVGGEAPEGIRIALGAVPDRRKLSEALHNLAAILTGMPASAGTLV